MKNTIKLMSTVILLSTMAGATTTFAAENSSVAKTQGKVRFEADTESKEPEKPVNPETDPEGTEVQPGEEPGGKPGTAGPLQINWAPNLDFELQSVSMKTEFYNAKLTPDKKNDDKALPTFVQLTDKRGTGAGWNLSVTQTKQFEVDKDTVLTGAKINFNNGKLSTNMKDKNLPSITLNGEINTEEGKLEAAEGRGSLEPGVKLNLLSADEKQGMGRYSLFFGSTEDTTAASSVQLEVPGSTTKYADKDYTAELIWNLESSPVNVEG